MYVQFISKTYDNPFYPCTHSSFPQTKSLVHSPTPAFFPQCTCASGQELLHLVEPVTEVELLSVIPSATLSSPLRASLSQSTPSQQVPPALPVSLSSWLGLTTRKRRRKVGHALWPEEGGSRKWQTSVPCSSFLHLTHTTPDLWVLPLA